MQMARALSVPAQPVLLERENERATIEALVGRAGEGVGRLLVIQGHAGIGKTSLLVETTAAARAAGLDVISARGGELEQEFAFGVVRQLFEPRLAAVSAEERAGLTAGAAALARPLVDESRLGSQQDAARDASFAMLHGLYWLAANFALRRPLLLAVDDLHWADAPSLRWIAYLARRLEGLPLLVAVASRAPEESARPHLLTHVLFDSAAVRLRPLPLRSGAVAMLVREALSGQPAPEFVAACQSATRGNPLFLRALLDTLAREGLEPTAENAALVPATGAEAVAHMVALRLAGLSAETVALLRAAAVRGEGAPLHEVSALAGVPVEAAASRVSLLRRLGLLRGDDPVEFVHPVVRAAIYQQMPAEERMRLHRRAGELLVDGGAPAEQAAGHLTLVPPRRDRFVADTLRRAAERSLARGAPQAATAYLRRALDEPPPDEQRAHFLQQLGIAELHVDAFAAVAHLQDALALTTGTVRRAEAALLYARALIWLDRFDVAVDVLARAIDRLGDSHQELRTLLEAVLIGASFWMPELREIGGARIGTIDERRLGDGLGAAVMRSHLAWHEVRLGRSKGRAVTLAKRALAGNLLSGSETLWSLTAIVTLALADEATAARRAYDRTIADARRRGDLLNLVPLLLLRGWLSLQQGDLLSAEEDLSAGELEVAEAASTTAAYRAGFLAELQLEQGRIEEAGATIEALRSNEPTHSEYRLFYLYSRGRVELARGNPAEALSDFQRIATEMAAVGASNPALVPWRSQAALALRLLTRTNEAREIALQEVELARRWGAPRPLGVALRTLGLLEGRRGEEHLREAVEVLRDSPARLDYARALVELGAALRRSNQRASAQQALRQGLDLAHRVGAAPVAERARQELAATGARPRRLARSGVEALTGSERRVARMAAEGMANKEIAQTLFVTVKAVEVHLSSVYRKLGIASRRELPRALADSPAGEAGGRV
jgi:DNA-binding CsgD family transcriptional regulator